ncbi:hypothetical protein NX821_001542 [Clostridium septicum]|uniref:Uncharacterized protein n=1 Tax=Clostridium septicum TaxID=1504 RepID=A0ABY5B3E8_CLOSE|nr:hypothetical protein [Clostridium septicum]USS02332.1 hypothetical protein NH397_07935 [Clostridium septicum]
MFEGDAIISVGTYLGKRLYYNGKIILYSYFLKNVDIRIIHGVKCSCKAREGE